MCTVLLPPGDNQIAVNKCIIRYSCTGLLQKLSGFQEVEVLRFLDNRHMKVVRLSTLRTGRLYPTRELLVSMGTNDTIGNRTHDFAA